MSSSIYKTANGRTVEIREVWSYNLEEEMANIREAIEKFPCVAMDTEFPGVVARPTGDFVSLSDQQYQTVRCNVSLMKLIQLGIALTDENGNFNENGCTCWQFNFWFSLNEDIFAIDSIELLKNSGIDFNKIERYGIDIREFGELFMMSGLVLNDDVKWTSFHSTYDFAYILKTITCADLPLDEDDFYPLFNAYFPNVYDIKYIMALNGYHGSLQTLADTLQVERIGPMHQAGSDSLLTGQIHFAMINKYFHGNDNGSEMVDKYKGTLYGLGNGHPSKFSSAGLLGSSSAKMSVSVKSTKSYGELNDNDHEFAQ